MTSPQTAPAPLVSVVAVNYNCKTWLDRFFPSIQAQTIFDRVELVLVDNTSTDGSDEICREKMAGWTNGVFLATGGNYGYGGGCNRGAAVARGKYLFFINPDVWLEPACLEELVKYCESSGASIASPRVLDYDTDVLQLQGAVGFDIFGCMTRAYEGETLTEPFALAAFYFITKELLLKAGGFDEEFFLFNEEMDLSWRVWIMGETIRQVPTAKIHHQGASSGDRVGENRTNENKRFWANRNQLLTLIKNGRFLLMGLVFTQLALMTAEAVAGSVMARRFSFARYSLFKPIADCWRLRKHIMAERRRIRGFRKRGDFWILRKFFTFRFGRWMDVKRLMQARGVKIDKAR
jgi:GT2 family glycosyltransferase